jgi:hypothetical protein
MGMDLYAVRPKTRKAMAGFYINVRAWSALAHVLQQSGCDISEIAWLNEGQRIRAATCREWAKTIRRELPTIKVLRIKRARNALPLCVTGKEKELIKSLPTDARRAIRLRGYKLIPLSPEDREWFENLCVFLEMCGGCRQY